IGSGRAHCLRQDGRRNRRAPPARQVDAWGHAPALSLKKESRQTKKGDITMQSSLKITMKLACALAFYTCALAAQAQGYPDKPITIVVPFAAGSGTDQQARIFAQAMTNEYKVPVVVDNRVGASGIIAAQHVARAAPDGYTLLMTTNTTHAANTHLFKKLPYDPVKDFTPVTLLGKGQMMLVVPATSPLKSLPELLAAARQHPGKLNFGSGSSSSRVAGEM